MSYTSVMTVVFLVVFSWVTHAMHFENINISKEIDFIARQKKEDQKDAAHILFIKIRILLRNEILGQSNFSKMAEYISIANQIEMILDPNFSESKCVLEKDKIKDIETHLPRKGDQHRLRLLGIFCP